MHVAPKFGYMSLSFAKDLTTVPFPIGQDRTMYLYPEDRLYIGLDNDDVAPGDVLLTEGAGDQEQHQKIAHSPTLAALEYDLAQPRPYEQAERYLSDRFPVERLIELSPEFAEEQEAWLNPEKNSALLESLGFDRLTEEESTLHQSASYTSAIRGLIESRQDNGRQRIIPKGNLFLKQHLSVEQLKDLDRLIKADQKLEASVIRQVRKALPQIIEEALAGATEEMRTQLAPFQKRLTKLVNSWFRKPFLATSEDGTVMWFDQNRSLTPKECRASKGQSKINR